MLPPSNQKLDEPKCFARRDRLLEIEHKAKEIWQTLHSHEKEPDPTKPKFFVNFPYPYMNGRLHLGHAFSLSKAEFYARYKALKGFNVLFPFGFHCTGMPICGASIKLREEMSTKYGLEELRRIRQARLLNP